MRHVLVRALPLALLAALVATPAAEAASVRLRGTAYEFNTSKVRLGGATIRVAEFPRLRARVRADGTYTLVVPDRARVTPYIEAAGYHTIHLQTFTTAGEDLVNVNFQTPTEPVYRALAAILQVPLDERGELRSCAIVSTFSTVNVRAVGFDAFTRYGAHGVAGATASASPALPAPVYFNEQVIPDRAQLRSSKDGGVVWTNVPSGVYTIRALHPTTRFARFVATCRPGRVVNANPPWGLHELAQRGTTRARATWRRGGARVALRSLRLSRLPAKATVRVRCTGRGCPFRSRTLRPPGSTADVGRALGAGASRLRAGQALEVAVTAPVTDGTVIRWAIGRRGTPRALTRCVPLGYARPRAC